MPTAQDAIFLRSGMWAHPEREVCPCNGSGWLLSNFDTWHQCPYHGKGVPHPEDEQVEYLEDLQEDQLPSWVPEDEDTPF